MPTLRAGDLRERIVFLSSTRTNDRGFATETYTTVAAVWAAVRLNGGSHENTQDRRTAKLALEIDIRYRSDITDEMRIVWRGKTFEIVAPLQINPVEGRLSISALEDESLSLAVDHITVSPESIFLIGGDTQPMTATCFDEDGNVVAGIVIWSSSNPAIASVDATTGLVTAVSVGSCTITASCEGKSTSVAAVVLASFASTLDLAFTQDTMFPNTQPAGLTLTPEGNSTRWVYDAGNGTLDVTRRVMPSPADWATGPVGFNLVNGNGWSDGGDQGADSAHHNLHWHRFNAGATMFTFSHIMAAYDVEHRDILPPPAFAGFWIKGTEGVGLTIRLSLSGDGSGTNDAATKTITLHAAEQYVALSGLLQGINNAAMLSGLSLCIWIRPTASGDATTLQNGHLDLLGCVPHFGPAPSDILTNPAALDRFRLRKPTTAAVSQGVAVGGMSLPIHPTRGLFVGQSAKNHLTDPLDVGQGSQWTKAGGWTVTDSGLAGPENGFTNTWKRHVVPPGATLTLAVAVPMEQGDSNLADGAAMRDTFGWIHGLLKQDSTNALPLNGDIQVEINGTGTYTAPWKALTQNATDGSVMTYRGRPHVLASNNATTFTVTLRNVSAKTLQFLMERIGLEREAYLATAVNTPESRDVGTFAMQAIQRPFTVTGLSDTPMQNLVRNRLDDATQIADFIGGTTIALRTSADWDVPMLKAITNPLHQVGRKLFDQGTYANDDTSFEVVVGENDAAGSGNISVHALCFPGSPVGGRRNHQITIALADGQLAAGAFHDWAWNITANVITAFYLDGLYYYRTNTTPSGVWHKIVDGVDSLAPEVSEIYQDGTTWQVTHGWYLLADRDFAAAWNGYLTAIDTVLVAGGLSLAQTEYLFARWTRRGVGAG